MGRLMMSPAVLSGAAGPESKRKPAVHKRPAMQRKPAAVTETASPNEQAPAPPYVGCASHPPWVDTYVKALWPFLEQWKTKGGQEIRLHIWADCAGLVSEMCAAKELEPTLEKHFGVKFKFVLYCACDKCPASKKFTLANNEPKHWTDDIHARDWGTGEYADTLIEGRSSTEKCHPRALTFMWQGGRARRTAKGESARGVLTQLQR